jgi:hypothetical protein
MSTKLISSNYENNGLILDQMYGDSENLIKNIVLTRFHNVLGPKILMSVINDAKLNNVITNLMDLRSLNENFFILGVDDKIIFNQHFSIKSPWARGGDELMMVSFVINDIDFIPELKNIVENYVQSFINVFKDDSDLFMGFYNKNQDQKSGVDEEIDNFIKEKNEKITYLFHSLSKFFQSLLIS